MRFRVWVVGLLVFGVSLAGGAQGRTRLGAPPPTFTVGGFRSDYGSIQDAVSAAPAEGAIIRIRPGVYRESVHVDRPGIQLRGDGDDPAKVILIFAAATSTLAVTGDGFFAEGMTFANDSGKMDAAALTLAGDRAVLRNVRVLGGLTAGSKDCSAACTLSRSYFEGCYLEGGFISGDAKVVFNGCEIRSVWGVAAFVFERCRFVGMGRVSPNGVLLQSEVAGKMQGIGASAGYGASAAGKGLTAEEARGYQVGVYLRGDDGWNPDRIR